MGIDVAARLVEATLGSVATRDAGIDLLNTRAGHAAEVPAGNAIANARSLARMYAATIGAVDGARLVSAETVSRATQPRTDGLSHPSPLHVLPVTHRFAHGYELSRPVSPMLGEGSFGHLGTGGRLAFAHPESGLAVAYSCTDMTGTDTVGPDRRWLPWLAALHETLG
ncbi:beta-lactamase family protein [Nocardia sp. NBC_01503]|uniref:serine hydrolase n=1 Tax=Nocardia sp. NBC_01503 TaxID=2975997 RepID=UPI002E7B26A5|nr:serine hydrolase [Nocardia sp. NBC_01503]WTL32110.1 beta-lactamase family protein [Nocardia sp. NBC_01503]